MLKVTRTELDGTAVNALVFKGTQISAEIKAIQSGDFFVEVSLHCLMNSPTINFLMYQTMFSF